MKIKKFLFIPNLTVDQSIKMKLKVVLFGTTKVGKTAITKQFVKSTFIEKYEPTIEESFQKTIKNEDEQEYTLDIFDTSGKEEYQILQQEHKKESNVYILVYSISDKNSFEYVKKLLKELLELHPTTPIVIVGNKTDLHEREVSKDDGMKLSLHSIYSSFIETSAKSNTNIDQIFLLFLKNFPIEKKKDDDLLFKKPSLRLRMDKVKIGVDEKEKPLTSPRSLQNVFSFLQKSPRTKTEDMSPRSKGIMGLISPKTKKELFSVPQSKEEN